MIIIMQAEYDYYGYWKCTVVVVYGTFCVWYERLNDSFIHSGWLLGYMAMQDHQDQQ